MEADQFISVIYVFALGGQRPVDCDDLGLVQAIPPLFTIEKRWRRGGSLAASLLLQRGSRPFTPLCKSAERCEYEEASR